MAQYQQYTQSSSHVVVSTSGSDINPVYMCCCPPCAIAEVEGCSAMTIACAFGCLFWPWNGLAAIFYHPQPPGQSNVVIVHQQRQGPPMQQYPPQQYPPQQYPPAQQMYGGAPPQYPVAYAQPVVGQPVDQTVQSQPPMPPPTGGQPMGGPPPMGGCEPAMQAPMGAESDVKPL